MLRFDEFDKERNYRVLRHGMGVFHQALQYVLQGERRFHVSGENGICYDLYYEENQKFAESSPLYSHMTISDYMPLYPPYLSYDENDVEKICFDSVEECDEIWFEKVSEYSVVIAKVLIEHTDKGIFFADERIRWFLQDERIRIAKEEDCPGAIKIYDDFVPSIFDANYSRMDSMLLFHHLFMFQWLNPLRISKVKYVELVLPRTEGIGSILIAYGRGSTFLKKALGPEVQITIKPKSIRYADSIIEKYLNIKYTPKDSDESNTIYIVNYYSFILMKSTRKSVGLDESIFKESFLDHLRFYVRNVMENKKVLGVMLRGTDYITTNLGGVRKPAPLTQAIDRIEELMETGGYDNFFLATEDGDILDTLKKHFGKKMLAVSQERYRVSDFTDEMKTISQIERERYKNEEEYNVYVEDVTVNYLYAIYMLSHCRSFVYSCHCSGASLVRQFAGSSFDQVICLAEENLRNTSGLL